MPEIRSISLTRCWLDVSGAFSLLILTLAPSYSADKKMVGAYVCVIEHMLGATEPHFKCLQKPFDLDATRRQVVAHLQTLDRPADVMMSASSVVFDVLSEHYACDLFKFGERR